MLLGYGDTVDHVFHGDSDGARVPVKWLGEIGVEAVNRTGLRAAFLLDSNALNTQMQMEHAVARLRGSGFERGIILTQMNHGARALATAEHVSATAPPDTQ